MNPGRDGALAGLSNPSAQVGRVASKGVRHGVQVASGESDDVFGYSASVQSCEQGFGSTGQSSGRAGSTGMGKSNFDVSCEIDLQFSTSASSTSSGDPAVANTLRKQRM